MPEQKSISDYEKEYPKLRKVTLCYLLNKENGEVLIAMKKRGFCAGRWNGIGGKLNEGESIEEALIREAKEEIGVTLTSFRKAGAISFYFSGPGSQDFNQEVHVFTADSWEGTPKESEEMAPKWVKITNLPFNEMWPDDRLWLKDVLLGAYVKAKFLFDESGEVKASSVKITSKKRVK